MGSVILAGLEEGNVVLAKLFPITERFRFKLEANAFKVLNKTNHSGLDSNASDGGFGRPNGSYPPRQMQFGAKLIF